MSVFHSNLCPAIYRVYITEVVVLGKDLPLKVLVKFIRLTTKSQLTKRKLVGFSNEKLSLLFKPDCSGKPQFFI